MRSDPEWQAACAIPRTRKQERSRAFSRLRQKYQFSEYALHDYAKGARVSWIADHIDVDDGANPCQPGVSCRQSCLPAQSPTGAFSESRAEG